MPIAPLPIDPRVSHAREALQTYLQQQGLTITQLAKDSGISQPQITKLLTGVRKRWSKTIDQLCQHAGIMPPPGAASGPASRRLSRALRQAVGTLDDPQATEVLARVVEALTPALVALRTPPPSEPRP